MQGEGGIHEGNKIFFKKLRDLCSENSLLLIFDEVQSGMGRTGSLWGYENLEVEPDAFTIAKGLGGGHAIGALLAKQNASLFVAGDHASTFGGNPFACKAGITVCNEIERLDLLRHIKQRGEELKSGLKEIIRDFPNLLKEVRGLGLIQGLVIQEECALTSQEVVKAAINEKLLIVPAGSKVVRMVPSLTIKKSEISELLRRLRASLMNCS